MFGSSIIQTKVDQLTTLVPNSSPILKDPTPQTTLSYRRGPTGASTYSILEHSRIRSTRPADPGVFTKRESGVDLLTERRTGALIVAGYRVAVLGAIAHQLSAVVEPA